MFDGPGPIYAQIAEQIRAEILAGVLRENEQVMSTTQYATTYRINPATAAKAFAELVSEGVLYKRRGVGMFVAPGARKLLLDKHRRTFFTEVFDPVLAQAALLGISSEELIAHINGTDQQTRDQKRDS